MCELWDRTYYAHTKSSSGISSIGATVARSYYSEVWWNLTLQSCEYELESFDFSGTLCCLFVDDSRLATIDVIPVAAYSTGRLTMQKLCRLMIRPAHYDLLRDLTLVWSSHVSTLFVLCFVLTFFPQLCWKLINLTLFFGVCFELCDQ